MINVLWGSLGSNHSGFALELASCIVYCGSYGVSKGAEIAIAAKNNNRARPAIPILLLLYILAKSEKFFRSLSVSNSHT